jgi:uncharacterized protein YicC (UPF0701 family)
MGTDTIYIAKKDFQVEAGNRRITVRAGTPLRLPEDILEKVKKMVIPATEEEVRACLLEYIEDAVSGNLKEYSAEEAEAGGKYIDSHEQIRNAIEKCETRMNELYRNKNMKPHERIKAMAEACDEYKHLINTAIMLAKLERAEKVSKSRTRLSSTGRRR